MLIPQPLPLQAPRKTKHVQPAVTETDLPAASDPPDILAIIHDNLVFLDRLDQILDAKSRAGYQGPRQTRVQ